MEWICGFDNTNYVMQNTTQKFRQSSIVFEKPGILSENLKTLTSFNYPTVQYFFAETSHTFCVCFFQTIPKCNFTHALFQELCRNNLEFINRENYGKLYIHKGRIIPHLFSRAFNVISADYITFYSQELLRKNYFI